MRIEGAVERPHANPDEWAALVSEPGDLVVETTRRIVDAVKPTRTSTSST
jgi:hypothetical protein